MLITQTDFSLSDQGELTTLRLVRPDAFTPEPVEAVVKATGRGENWKLTQHSARQQERIRINVTSGVLAIKDAINRRIF
jgi:prophage tail gpP-like protein